MDPGSSGKERRALAYPSCQRSLVLELGGEFSYSSLELSDRGVEKADFAPECSILRNKIPAKGILYWSRQR